MEAKLLFGPGTAKTFTTSDIFVDGSDVYELRGSLRGTAVAYRSDGYWKLDSSDLTVTGNLKKRSVASKERTPREGFLADEGAWLAGGDGGILRSTDQGKTWKREAVPCGDQQIVSLVRHGDKLWVAGMDGYLAVRDGKTWTSIERPAAKKLSFSEFGHSLPYPVVTLTKLVSTGDELFVLGHGIWKIDPKKQKAELAAPSKALLIDLAKTAKGTLIAIGTKGAVLRREGKSWKAASSGKDPIVGVVPLGDEVLIASTTQLSLSTDDGKSFKAIKKQPKLNPAVARYTVAKADGQGGAFVAGWRGLLVRVAETDATWTASASAPVATKAKTKPVAHAKPTPKNAKEEAQFLADIIASPDDDGPRLVYADWLTEHGDPRGELIQLQCTLKRAVIGTVFRPLDEGVAHPDALELGKRESEILKKNAKDWLAPIRKYFYQWNWQRGFLRRVTGNGAFFPGAQAVLSAHPLTRLELTGLKKTDLAKLATLDLGSVTGLNLTENRITDREVPHLCGKNLEKLETLLLTANPLGDEGVTMLATKSHLYNLRELSIYGGDFGNDALIAIAKSPIFANLELLGIRRSRVTSVGLMALAESKTLEKLQHVDHGLSGKPNAKAVAALNKKLKPGYDGRAWDPYTMAGTF